MKVDRESGPSQQGEVRQNCEQNSDPEFLIYHVVKTRSVAHANNEVLEIKSGTQPR